MKTKIHKLIFIFATLIIISSCKQKTDVEKALDIEIPEQGDNTSTDYTVPLEYSINGVAKKGSMLVTSQANPYFCADKSRGGALGYITYLDTKFSFDITNFKPEGGTFDSYDFAKPDCDKMTISAIIDDLGNQYANSGGSLTLYGNKYTLKHDNLIFRNGPGNPDKITKVSLVATWTKP
jgi:hypothetical protein